jgi:hypothetical protein
MLLVVNGHKEHFHYNVLYAQSKMTGTTENFPNIKYFCSDNRNRAPKINFSNF